MGKSGCTARTVRYYEEHGLIAAGRSSGGHRLFEESQLERLELIIALREAGWSIDEVSSFFARRDDPSGDHEACARLSSIVQLQLGRLERKLSLLQGLRDDLSAMRDLLPSCLDCTKTPSTVTCDACDRIPPSAKLSRSFRLGWREGRVQQASQAVLSSELLRSEPFDEPSADDGHS